jgi:hypothetical protein
MSEALQALSKVLNAEEWAGFVALSLDRAGENRRKHLLFALTAYNIPLQLNIPTRHRDALKTVLKKWNPTGNPTPFPSIKEASESGAAK